jgi:hypothetical protein
MIELIPEQRQAVSESGATPPVLVDPETHAEYFLVRPDVYKLLTDPEFDASPWTPAEREALAWEAGKHAGWEEMNEFDAPEQP